MTLPLTYPVDALVSYHYFRSHDAMSVITSYGRLRLIADSGAFSAFTQGSEVKIDEYAAWLHTWRDHLYWAAALDVLGDPEATFRNFTTLLQKHQLKTVPTLHIGTSPKWLDTYSREGVDFVGLGGMVGVPSPKILRWLVSILKYARDHYPYMRFHAWGVSHISILNRIPLYSADSSGTASAPTRFAELRLYDPKQNKNVIIPMDGKAPYQHRRMLKDTYGVAPAHVAHPSPGNKKTLTKLALTSVQQLSLRMQQRHQVAPPVWGLHPQAPALPGIRIHVVASNYSSIIT